MPGSDAFEDLCRRIREGEPGCRAMLETPYGRRRVAYADLTATGRHLDGIESWMARARPFYANTHTAASSTGRLMTRLREQAREIIRRSVGAAADDQVLFVGSGATAAVNKLVGLLGIRISEPLDRRHRFVERLPQRPAVLVGPYEHHSNELPWLESVAEVFEVGLDHRGGIDRDDLSRRLEELAHRPLLIGSFSAASNVTGLISDVPALARILHRGGALAFFDYAASAPYVPIDMHPADPDERIDALFLSPHKFVGGAEASGVLVAHRSLFRTRAPERPGGGAVDYVAGPRREEVDYVARLEEREEAGTPAILGDLRAALAFPVKDRLGPRRIRDHEVVLARRALDRLARHPRVRVLGPREADRLAILPFEIEGLHHDLTTVLLDHLFGIQTRAGCSCAGPYGHRLLGIDAATSRRYRDLVRRGLHGMKPGWSRLSIPYYASREEVDFLLSAVEALADHGEAFVPLYRFHWGSGDWPPVEVRAGEAPLDLRTAEPLELPPEDGPVSPDEGTRRRERARYLAEARRLAGRFRERWRDAPPHWNPPTGVAEIDELVWFRYVHSEGLEETAAGASPGPVTAGAARPGPRG